MMPPKARVHRHYFTSDSSNDVSGFVIAEILSEAIDAYAAAGHLQVKDVLDLALREFFDRRGWPAGEGARGA
jgi:hypothetical protein